MLFKRQLRNKLEKTKEYIKKNSYPKGHKTSPIKRKKTDKDKKKPHDK